VKIVHRVLAILLIVAMLSALTACAGGGASTDGIVLTDQAGRTVVLEKEAERVVSCYYVTTYSMLSLGLKEKLVGIEKKAETRPVYRMVDEAILNLPAVGTMKEIDVEMIASLKPDLVILPKKLLDSADALETVGIKTAIVNPETQEDLYVMLKLIGKACGVEEKADELIKWSDTRLEKFTAEKTPSVLCLGKSSYLTAAPKTMYQNDLIELAGGQNAFSESEETYWTEISYETVLAMNPDYIVIPSGAEYGEEDIQKDETLSALTAVKENRVLSVPSAFEEWDSPIPSAVLGILWLRSRLHPSDYTSESLRKDIVEFYETFYCFTPDNETLSLVG